MCGPDGVHSLAVGRARAEELGEGAEEVDLPCVGCMHLDTSTLGADGNIQQTVVTSHG